MNLIINKLKYIIRSRLRKNKKIVNYYTLFLYSVLLLSITFPVIVSANSPTIVRVGMYQNAPKIFIDDQGNASGFWPDIIEYIASKEEWEIKYIQDNWTECLEKLEKNEIDIMPDVSYTEKRSKLYAFSNEVVLASWSRVYAKKSSNIQSFIDLEGKNIAVLKGSANVEGPGGIKEVIKKFDLNCTFIELDNYTKVFELVESGEADAGVTNKDFGNMHEKDFNIKRTAIVFRPSNLQFAFSKNSSLTPNFIERIDYHMKELKKDEDSIYYQSLEKWLATKPLEQPVTPGWLTWTLVGLGGFTLLLAGGSFILKSQVESKTKELIVEITERKKVEKNIRERNEELERMNELFLDREDRIIELKDELKKWKKVATKENKNR